MLAKRWSEVTTETHSLTIARLRQRYRKICQICGASIPHVTVSAATAIISATETAVFRLAEAGEIHSIETADGRLMVCSDSIANLRPLISQTTPPPQ